MRPSFAKEEMPVKNALVRFAAVLALALLLAASGVEAAAAGHDCGGSDCPVCALLDGCGRLLSLGCPPAAPNLWGARFLAVCAVALSAAALAAVTPVSRKIRLND